MWWLFSGVRKSRDNFKSRIDFQVWNRGVNSGIRSWKKLNWLRLMSVKSLVIFISQRMKEVKSRESTTWFRVWQFQTPPTWKRYLQTHLLAEWFFFGGHDRGLLTEGVKTYLKTPTSPSDTLTCFLLSHLLSKLWESSSTNVAPIIQTHNILTSHNRTPKNHLEPIKNALLLWVRLSGSNIWKIIMGTLLDNFLRLMP
jgi:hypothetical protein